MTLDESNVFTKAHAAAAYKAGQEELIMKQTEAALPVVERRYKEILNETIEKIKIKSPHCSSLDVMIYWDRCLKNGQTVEETATRRAMETLQAAPYDYDITRILKGSRDAGGKLVWPSWYIRWA